MLRRFAKGKVARGLLRCVSARLPFSNTARIVQSEQALKCIVCTTLIQVEVREEAARALALFSSKRDSQAQLVRSGVISKLVSLARSSDIGSRRFGVLGIGNLAVVTQNHQAIFEGGGVSSLLLESVYATDDLETRRCVAFALNNIAGFEANHRACERAGVLRPLVRLLRDEDPDTHLQAAFAIRQLSVTARCRFQLVEMKGLAPLLR